MTSKAAAVSIGPAFDELCYLFRVQRLFDLKRGGEFIERNNIFADLFLGLPVAVVQDTPDLFFGRLQRLFAHLLFSPGNISVSALKHRKTRLQAHSQFKDHLPGQHRGLQDVELIDLLDRALALLPPETRDALVQHYVDELPQAEIARRLGASEKPRIGFLLRCGNILDPEVEAAVVAATVPIGAADWLAEHGDGAAIGATSLAAAAAAGAVNNLPALLASLGTTTRIGWAGWAWLLGVNAGAVLVPTGALANLLWLRIMGAEGAPVTWSRYVVAVVPIARVRSVRAFSDTTVRWLKTARLSTNSFTSPGNRWCIHAWIDCH